MRETSASCQLNASMQPRATRMVSMSEKIAMRPSEKVSLTASTSVMVRVVEVPMAVVSKYWRREKMTCSYTRWRRSRMMLVPSHAERKPK